MEPRRLLANLGELGIYLVDHSTHQRVANPYAGEEVEIHATFAATGISPGTVVRIQRDTADGTLYTEIGAPASWSGQADVERSLFTWTVPPRNAWVTVTLDPRNTVAETDESDNAQTLTVTPSPDPISLAVPVYHSLPGAHYALYLDFDGNYQTDFAGSADVTTPVYDTDGNPFALSPAEQDEIRQIWARVAEDYAPFAIDVTTELPRAGQYVRWQRVAIGGASCDWYQFSAAGTALQGSFAQGADSAAFVFTEQANGDGSATRYPVATVADAVSHEAGHTFGLAHQAQYDAGGELVTEYNPGKGDWGPIMGRSGNVVSTWYNGPTSESATAYQDDMAVIASSDNGFGYRPDDVGDDPAHAADLGTLTDSLSAAGVIGTNTDVDFYKVALPAGRYRFAANVAADGPNLDAVIELRDAAGNILTGANPADQQSAFIDTDVSAGTYYVSVHSTGVYGWIGQYTLTITPPPPPAQPGPPAPPAASGPAPDLAIALPVAPPTTITAGTKGTVQVALRNVGNRAAVGPLTVRVYASRSRGLGATSVLLGTTVVRSTISARGATSARVQVSYARTLRASGAYFLVATVEGAGAERSATNNVVASKASLKVIVPAARLTASVSPPRTKASQRLWNASVAVRNDGNVSFSGRAIVSVYASKDGVLGDDDDILIGSATLSGKVAVGGSRTVNAPAIIGSAGTYRLFAVVSPVGGSAVPARKSVRVRFT